MTWRPGRVPARPLGAFAAFALVVAAPAAVAAHGLSPIYQSPLPLAVYLVGAATTVALSFVFVLARDLRAGPVAQTRIARGPRAVRIALRVLGLGGWAWIIAQAIAGGSPAPGGATVFL